MTATPDVVPAAGREAAHEAAHEGAPEVGSPDGGRRRRPRAPEPTPPVGPASPASLVLSSALTVTALLCLWLVLHLLVFGALAHDRSQRLLDAEFRTQLASATAPVGPVVAPGAPVALLRIPAIGLDEVVVEGTASADLTAGPGHRRDTVLPGQVGSSVLHGRAVTYGAPFADLARLVRGDVVEVTTGQGRTTLRVLGVRRDGDPLPQPAAAGAARLTLVTAEGRGRFGALMPGEAVYVDAEAAQGQPAPAGRASGVPTSEDAMASGTEALPLLTLWLALLVGGVVAALVARERWTRSQVWTVASAPLLALAWISTDTALRLLPTLV